MMFSHVEPYRGSRQHGAHHDQGYPLIRSYSVVQNSPTGLVPVHIVIPTSQEIMEMVIRRRVEAAKQEEEAAKNAKKAELAKLKKERTMRKKKIQAEQRAKESQLQKAKIDLLQKAEEEGTEEQEAGAGKLPADICDINSNVSHSQPEKSSCEKFERLVLSSPNSSTIWIRYMTHHLQASEIEEARAVAKRAIKNINLWEKDEKLNVWRAWLNLESKFGNAQTLNDVFQEAVKKSNAVKIYLHMLTLHADAKRYYDIEKIVATILRKFKLVPQAWIACSAALMKIEFAKKSRHIMLQALQSLPTQEHVNLLVKFAEIETEFGDKERAQLFFEQALSSHSDRVDVWLSYVDALLKCNDIDTAREVLERAVAQDLPARKIHVLIQKYIDFEDVHGTIAGVTSLRQLAAKYDKN